MAMYSERRLPSSPCLLPPEHLGTPSCVGVSAVCSIGQNTMHPCSGACFAANPLRRCDGACSGLETRQGASLPSLLTCDHCNGGAGLHMLDEITKRALQGAMRSNPPAKPPLRMSESAARCTPDRSTSGSPRHRLPRRARLSNLNCTRLRVLVSRAHFLPKPLPRSPRPSRVKYIAACALPSFAFRARLLSARAFPRAPGNIRPRLARAPASGVPQLNCLRQALTSSRCTSRCPG
ncbi:hypothetical protein C8Q80DRAFT_788351 [Daedaleopsis nitida]|nr:hypothetical protein C8Q80DRAFT_788351 [Daedaleopsis nitida]